MSNVRSLSFFPVLALFFTFLPSVNAQEVPVKNESKTSWRFFLGPRYSTLSTSGASLTGAGLSAQAGYITDERWDLGATLSHTLGISTQTSFFTSVQTHAIFALTGNFKSRDTNVYLGRSKILSASETPVQGWRLKGLLSQYFFHASSAVVSYSGFGAGIGYEKQYGKEIYMLTLDSESVYNGSRSFQILQIGLALKL